MPKKTEISIRRRYAMLHDYTRFTTRIMSEYDRARACLEQEDYVGAHNILARIALSHAKTAMSLRNVLVRNGLMEEDK